jgi:hypothetical protein
VDHAGVLRAGSGATGATRLGTGSFRVTFNQAVNTCVTQATSTDATGGAVPTGTAIRIFGTDNRIQETNTTVDVSSQDANGTQVDPATLDGFVLTVFC